jgi:hypothetical protein
VFNKTNVNVNGKFNASAAIELAKVGYQNDPLWLNLTIEGITTCYKIAEEKSAEIANITRSRKIDGITNCLYGPYYAFMVQCMFGHNFINCPVYNHTIRGCDLLKNYLIACSTSVDIL